MLPFRGLSVWLPVRLSRSCIVPKWQKISTGFLLHTTAPHFHMFQQHFILFYFIELTMLLSASFTCLDACCCHGLRLPVFNKETTYLLIYLLTCLFQIVWKFGLDRSTPSSPNFAPNWPTSCWFERRRYSIANCGQMVRDNAMVTMESI